MNNADDDLLKDLNEQGIFAQVLTTMQKTPRWAVTYIGLASLIFIGAAIWFAVEFFRATEMHHMIAWATGFIAAMLIIIAIKVWFWMQMVKYVLLREIKRLEQRFARPGE